MPKLLIYANANNYHSIKRSLVGQEVGFEVIWVSAEQVNLPGVKSYFLPSKYSRSLISRAIFEPFLIFNTIRRVNPDIIHVHFASKGLAAVPVSRYHPLIVSCQGGDIFPDQAYRGFYAPFVRYLLNRADCITSMTDYMDLTLKEMGDYGKKIRRITWGVDMEEYCPDRDISTLRERLDIQPDVPVFFDPRKAQPFYNKNIILEGFAKYLASGCQNAVLLISEIGGEPEYIRSLKKLAERLGIINHTRFVGIIKEKDMPDYYTLSDVTISHVPSDGKPQTLMEAMACRSFPIATNIPHYQGLLENGKTAYLTKLGDVDDLSQAMKWAVQHPIEREKATFLGREFVNKYANFNEQKKLMNELYKEFLATSHRA